MGFFYGLMWEKHFLLQSRFLVNSWSKGCVVRDVWSSMSCVEKDTLDNLEILTEGIVTADEWTFDTAKLSVYGCGGGVVSYANPFYW